MFLDPDWRAEEQSGVPAMTSGGNDNNDDDQSGDLHSWKFKQKSDREETKMSALKNGDSKKKSVQPNKNDIRASQDVKVQWGRH